MAGLLSDIGNAIGGAVSWGEGVAAGIGQAVYGGATSVISAGQSGAEAIETGGASLLTGAGNAYNSGLNTFFGSGGGGGGYGGGGAGGRAYIAPPVAIPNVVSPISSTGIAPAINLATAINPIAPVAALGLAAGGILGGLVASQKPQGLQQENLTELTPQPAKVQSPSTSNPFAIILSGISDIFGSSASPARASDIPSVNIGFGTITGNQNYPTLAASRSANNLLASELASLPAPYIASPKTPSDVTTFVPYGNYAQTAIPNTKVVYEPGGEADIYQEIFNPGGTPFWNLISSGSRNALQSGMFTIEKPETPLVYTQPGAAAGSLSSYANPAGAAKVLASPVNYSELGSEVYGGYVVPLSGKTVQGTGASLSTYSNPYNLANLVSPTAVNESKTQLPDISAPWSISNKSPVLQELNIGGLTKAYLPGTDLGDITPAATSILGSGGKTTQQQGGLTFSLLSPFGNNGFGANAAGISGVNLGFGSISGGFTAPSSTPSKTSSPLLTTLLEGDLSNLDALTSLPNALSFGIIPKWTPGSDFLASAGLSGSSALTAANTRMSAATASLSQQTPLINEINSDQSQISALTSGKINSQGQFTGSNADYATLQLLTDTVNTDVAKVNQLNKNYQDALGFGFSSGAYIPTSNGGYAVAPSAARPYGAFSDWANSVQQNILGVSVDKLAAYENTPAFKSAPLIEQFGEGAAKIITNPATLMQNITQGVGIYGLTMGMGELLEGLAPAEGSTSGILGKIASVGTRISSSPLTTFAIGGTYAGVGIYNAAESPEGTFASNLGSLTGSAYGIGLGAVGAGLSPRVIDTSLDLTKSGLSELNYRLSDVSRLDTTISYQTSPNPKMPSGTALDVSVKGSLTKMTPYKVAGIPVFPRIFEAEPSSVFDESQTYDASVIGARLTGVETPAVSGIRTISQEIINSPFSDLAHGVGELGISETMLKRPMADYINMGESDVKVTGLSPEETTFNLLQQATSANKLTTGSRFLDVYGTKGSSFEDLFNWNTKKGEGETIEFNTMNIEDYVTKMMVDYSGLKPSDYGSTILERTVTEEGLGEGGLRGASGSQAPESKIVGMLQTYSQITEAGEPETAFVFNKWGKPIYSEIGEVGSVSTIGSMDAMMKEIEAEGEVSHAHTHPNVPVSAFVKGTLGALEHGDILNAAATATNSLFRSEILNNPSYGDYFSFGENPSGVNAEYISTPKGVLKISPFEETTGNIELSNNEGESSIAAKFTGQSAWGEFTQMGSELKTTDESSDWFTNRTTSSQKVAQAHGATIEFIGKNTPFTGESMVSPVPDITSEMKSSYPEGVRNQIVDVIDRIALGNPNYEFVRESFEERPLTESGRNLGTSMGSGNQRYLSPMSSYGSRSISVADESVFGSAGSASELENLGSSRISVKPTTTAYINDSDIFSTTPSFETKLSFTPIFEITSSPASVRASAISSLVGITPLQWQQPSSRNRQEIATAFDIRPEFTIANRVKQNTKTERVTAYKQRSAQSSITDLDSDIESIFTPLSAQRSATIQIQNPLFIQLTDIMPVQIRNPPPNIKKTPKYGQLFGIPPGASTPGGLMAVQHGKYATPWIETIKLNRLL